jgi:hypothetical protein
VLICGCLGKGGRGECLNFAEELKDFLCVFGLSVLSSSRSFYTVEMT